MNRSAIFSENAPSTLISQKDGSSAMEFFIKNNVMYIVYGSYDAGTVDKIANLPRGANDRPVVGLRCRTRLTVRRLEGARTAPGVREPRQ